MDIVIPQLSAEEKQQLLAQHAHRHPQGATFLFAGDHGSTVRLSVLLGLPSGAARMPGGATISSAWRNFVAGEPSIDALAADCLLWPGPEVVAAWRSRWPGLDQDVGNAALRHAGFADDCIVVADRPAPKVVAEALAVHPRAIWRVLRSYGPPLDVIIDAPGVDAYEAFSDSFERKDPPRHELLREFADAHTVALFDGTGAPTRIAEAFDRYPGFALLVAYEARKLGRASGQVRMGEW